MNFEALAVALLIGAVAVFLYGMAGIYAYLSITDRDDPLLPWPVAVIIIIFLVMLGTSFTILAGIAYQDLANPNDLLYYGEPQ